MVARACKRLVVRAETLQKSAQKNPGKRAAGQRPVVDRQMVDGFEKLVMGPYSWQTYAEYIAAVDSFGSGLAKSMNFSKGDTIVIYADTQRAWMQCAYGAWRQGLVVGTIYATLGEEGAVRLGSSKGPLASPADPRLVESVAGSSTASTSPSARPSWPMASCSRSLARLPRS